MRWPSTGLRAPGHGGAGFDGFIILIQSGGEASQGLQRTGGRTREPRIELRRLPLTDQRGKVLRQVYGLGDLGRLRTELGQLLRLGLGALGLTPEDEPSRPATALPAEIPLL